MILRTLPFEWLALPCTLVDWSSSSCSQRMSLEKEYCVFFPVLDLIKIEKEYCAFFPVLDQNCKIAYYLWRASKTYQEEACSLMSVLVKLDLMQIWNFFFDVCLKTVWSTLRKYTQSQKIPFHHGSFSGIVPWAGFNTMAPIRICIKKRLRPRQYRSMLDEGLMEPKVLVMSKWTKFRNISL